MNLTFPIQFKYFYIERGPIQRQNENDVPQDGYVLKDLNGVTVASGSNVYRLVEHCMQQDIQAEMATQMVERWLPIQDYLDGVDIDRKPDLGGGIMIPANVVPPSGGGQQGGGGSGPIH